MLIACSQTFAATIVDTGGANNGIAVATRPDALGKFEIEAADDFTVGPASGIITNGTFTGLLTSTGVAAPSVLNIIIEIYRVFPLDSTVPPSGHVLTRNNSPSDVAFLSEDASVGELTFSSTVISSSFTALNSVQAGGVPPLPNQKTGGNGPVTGAEVKFNFSFTTPFLLPADHYFFVPQVEVSGGEFLWLSGDRPLTGTDIGPTPDLQMWTRDEALNPDWSRVGTDIVGGTTPPTFNGAFSLDGTTTPEPATFGLCFAALGLAGLAVRRRRSS
jgi:MYXO-CTERM domain-containing protein